MKRHIVVTYLLVVLTTVQGCATSRTTARTDADNPFTELRNVPPTADQPMRDWLDEHKGVKYTGIGVLVVGGVVLVAGALLIAALASAGPGLSGMRGGGGP